MKNLQTLNQNVKYTQCVCVGRSILCMRRAKFLEVNFIEALPQSIGSAEVNNYLLWVLFTVRGNEAIAGGCCVFALACSSMRRMLLTMHWNFDCNY